MGQPQPCTSPLSHAGTRYSGSYLTLFIEFSAFRLSLVGRKVPALEAIKKKCQSAGAVEVVCALHVTSHLQCYFYLWMSFPPWYSSQNVSYIDILISILYPYYIS